MRAVTGDIKNASNYSLSVSSWRFLADIRSLNNYYPYGSLIDEGSWSGSSYNFGYNGMLKEGIGKDIYHTLNRALFTEVPVWIKTDPLEFQFPWRSPYISMGNNPISRVDPNGDSDYEVDKEGFISMVGEPNDDKKDVLFAHDDDGKIDLSKFLALDKGILDKKQTKKNQNEKSYDLLTLENDMEAHSLFKFLSQNSDVEWSRIIIGKENVNGKNFLTTSHSINREAGAAHMFGYEISTETIIRGHFHSHNSVSYPSGIDYPRNLEESQYDMYNLIWVRAHMNAGNASFYIYYPKQDIYLKYDEKTTKSEYDKSLLRFNMKVESSK